MKKILVALMLCMVSIVGFGQLKTKTVEEAHGYETVYNFWMGYGEIRYAKSSYILFGASTNQFEDSMCSILLGDNKDEAIKSLKDLGELKKKCPNTIVVSGFGNKETTIYSFAGETVFETDGVAGFTHALFYLNINKAISAIENFDDEDEENE